MTLTERDMLRMLQARHGERSGNGDAWVFMTHVRDAAGFNANRTLDAIAMSLWPSRGLLLDGFEVKCSRSDWLRELKDPAKADGFHARLDRFWLVVADASIVQAGELPTTWGLLVARGGKLVQSVAAPMLRPKSQDLPPGFGRSFLAAMLRAVAATAAMAPEEVEKAKADALEHAKLIHEDDLRAAQEKAERATGVLAAFQREAGISLSTFDWRGRDPAKVGRAVRLVLDGEDTADRIRQRLEQSIKTAEAIAESARQELAALDAHPVAVEEPAF